MLSIPPWLVRALGLFTSVKLGIVGVLCRTRRAPQGAGFTPLPEQKAGGGGGGRRGLGWAMPPCPAGGPAAAPLKGPDKVQQGTSVNGAVSKAKAWTAGLKTF